MGHCNWVIKRMRAARKLQISKWNLERWNKWTSHPCYSATTATSRCSTRSSASTTPTTRTRWPARTAAPWTRTSWSRCPTASPSAPSRCSSSGHNRRRCRGSPPTPPRRLNPGRSHRPLAAPPLPPYDQSSTPAWLPGTNPRPLRPSRNQLRYSRPLWQVSPNRSPCSAWLRKPWLWASVSLWLTGIWPPYGPSPLSPGYHWPAAACPGIPRWRNPRIFSCSPTTSWTIWTRSHNSATGCAKGPLLCLWFVIFI